MLSAAQVGGHEWLEAVPSHPRFVIEPVEFVHAFRHYLGLHPFGGGGAGEPGQWPLQLPQVCKCRIGECPVWRHVPSCNALVLANARHEDVRLCWEELLAMLRANVLIAGEFAPYGSGDDRRVDGLISGVPGLPRETGVDYAVTSVTCLGGAAAGARVALGAATEKEKEKCRGHVAGRRTDLDMLAAGFGFLPIVHETTGALGHAAHDSLLSPLLLRMQEDDALKAETRAALERAGPLPWNVRSVRAYFLRRVGVCIARVVGSQIASAKWRGRRALDRAQRAQAASGSSLQRRPSGLAGAQRVSPAGPQQPLRSASLA